MQGGRAARGATGRPARPGGAGKPPSQRKARLVRLGDVCAIVQGQSPPSPSCTGDPESGLPFYQGKAEFGRMYPTPNRWCSEPVKVAIKNDILVSVRAPVGDVNICPGRCCIGRGIMAVRAQEGVDHMYVFYYLRYIQGRIRRLGSGTTFMSITGEQLRGVKISMPGLERQRRIASILSNVDAAIESVEKHIAHYGRLKNSLMTSLLSSCVQTSNNTKAKRRICDMLRLDKHAGSWASVPLSQLCGVNGSADASSTIYVGLEHIVSCKNYILAPGHVEDFKTHRPFQKNNILYGKLRPELNKVWLATCDGHCSVDILVLSPRTKTIVPTLLLYFLACSKFVKLAVSLSSGTKMPRTSWTNMKNIRFLVPPLETQHRVASILSGVDAQLALVMFELKFLIIIAFFNIGLKIPILSSHNYSSCKNLEAGCALTNQ